MSGSRASRQRSWTGTDPTALSTLPNQPLTPDQVFEVRRAVENSRDVPTTIWIAQGSGVTGITEFIVEDPTTFHLYQRPAMSDDGHWMRHAGVHRNSASGEACAAEIVEEEYAALREVIV